MILKSVAVNRRVASSNLARGAKLLLNFQILAAWTSSFKLHCDEPDEVGHFMQGNDASCRVVHREALRLVGVVHHQDGMHAGTTGCLNALQSVGKKHRLLSCEGSTVERADEWSRLHAPCIIAGAHARQEVAERIAHDKPRHGL